MFGGKTCHVFTRLEHVFFFTCTRLDLTDGIIIAIVIIIVIVIIITVIIIIIIYCSVITSSPLRSRSCLSQAIPPSPPPPHLIPPRGGGKGSLRDSGPSGCEGDYTSLVLVNIESVVSMYPVTCKLTSLVIPTCIANKRLLGLKNHLNILFLQQRLGRHDS